MIRHLRHSEIDKAQWDALLAQCADRLWYMQSWVLDLCCPNWEALVDLDERAIMPLLFRRKYGVDYLYQPYALQQQGVFAAVPGDATTRSFLDAVPKRFRYWDIHVNAQMSVHASGDLHVSANENQQMRLDADLHSLRAGYSQGHRRNLRKCGERPPEITERITGSEFVALFQRTTAARFSNVPEGGLQLLEHLLTEGRRRGQCSILGVRGDHGPIAAACFMEWEGRSIVLKTANDEEGTACQAMFHILDHYIADHAGSGLLLDFAGSNTASVARFNQGFGAQSTVYLRLKRNRLPLPLRWFKR